MIALPRRPPPGSARAARRLASGLLLLALAGCAPLPPAPQGGVVQLVHVPAWAQDELQCGPAALASVLAASGVATTPDALKPDLYIPARGGSLQVELIAQARRRGRVPLLIEPSEAALIEALRAGQPVLLLLNLGLRSWPTWHYAALTGHDPARGYVLNAGQAQAETMRRDRFLRRWDWAGRWGLSLHAPDAPPAYASPARWIAAVAPMERQAPALAMSAYRAAVARWPDAALAWAALGGSEAAAGNDRAALAALRRARSLAPDDAAIANNLASVALGQGCVDEARRTLAGIDAARQPAAVAAALEATAGEIAAAGRDHCRDSAAP